MKSLLVGLLCMALASAGCSRDETKPNPYAAEIKAREEFAKAKLNEVDAGRAWTVSSTSEVTFEEGFGIVMYDPPDQTKNPSFYNHAFRWMGQNGHVRLKTHKDRDMKILIAGWIHENVIRTKPMIELFIDGYYVHRLKPEDDKPIENGHYWIEEKIPSWMLKREWVDLIVKITSVGFHWGDPPELNVALVYRFEWKDAD